MGKFNEPWKASNGTVTTSGRIRLCHLFGYDARIVACVNACEGMEDPAAEIKALKDQRDELLAALENFCILNRNHYKDIAGFIDHAGVVCAKVKGGPDAN